MTPSRPLGVVTAARAEAAAAGVSILKAGGNAADAAVATAFALAVTDPANCGIGGYGGFAVVSKSDGRATQIAFNTHVPAAFDANRLSSAPRRGPFLHSGASVSPPAVVAGLKRLHSEEGSSDWPALVAPAIALADDGFVVGPDLAAAIAWAFRSEPYLSLPLRALLSTDGRAIDARDRLQQRDLATTLRAIADTGADALRNGATVNAILTALDGAGGTLTPGDFHAVDAHALTADTIAFRDAILSGCDDDETGFGVVRDVLSNDAWPHDRGAPFVDAMTARLDGAWRRRDGRFRDLSMPARAAIQHTTHLCAADRDGLVVSMTFTHGPLWFGSGVMAPGTGIILNCGANLFVEEIATGRRLSQTNVCPMILRSANGSRVAFGTPGGRKIPAMAAALAVDLVVRGDDVETALANPRVSVGLDGTAELEAPLDRVFPGSRSIARNDFYGPASAISWSSEGDLRGHTDPRFSGASMIA